MDFLAVSLCATAHRCQLRMALYLHDHDLTSYEAARFISTRFHRSFARWELEEKSPAEWSRCQP